MNDNKTVVVIGGGIAGISCIEALFHDYDPSRPQYKQIVLISSSRLVKRIQNYVHAGRQLEQFDVSEESCENLSSKVPVGLQFKQIVGHVKFIDTSKRNVVYMKVDKRDESTELAFDFLCLCNGSKPRSLSYSDRENNDEIRKRIIVIRDTNTVNQLRVKLANCRRLVVVGNGGISLELVSKVSDCRKTWMIRDESIGATYFDSGAAKFLLDAVQAKTGGCSTNLTTLISHTEVEGRPVDGDLVMGPALGPNWCQKLNLKGNFPSSSGKLEIVYQDEVANIEYIDKEYPLRVLTKNNKQFDCDLIVSAIGVEPNILEFRDKNPDTSSKDEGILVDSQMRTSLEHIYAAGDVVSCEKWTDNKLWFQMRLWTQARQMGYYAGRCLAAHINGIDPSIYFNFECFTHCTNFFGYKLVLLGRYNGQNCVHSERFEVLARVNPSKDYVKILVTDSGRIMGAVLVGDSGMEETIENLIHNQLDIGPFKEQLLDDTVDIEDYFD